MATSYNSYTGDGVTTAFAYTFDLPRSANIVASIDGVETTAFTINEVLHTINFTVAPASGASVLIARESDLSYLNKFAQGAAFTGVTLDENFELLVNTSEESRDTANLLSQLTLRVPRNEGSINELAGKAERLGKLLGFHATTGQPVMLPPESGSATDVLLTLSQPDGATLIGATYDSSTGTVQSALDSKVSKQTLASNKGELGVGTVRSVADLRNIEPTADRQRITLIQHTADTGKGGGQFRSLLNGTGYTDNNGTVIKTVGGAVWLRIGADVLNPLMFGGVGDGVANDTTAVNAALAIGVKVDLLGRTWVTAGLPFRMDVLPGLQDLYNGVLKDGTAANNNILSVGGKNKTVRDVTFDGTNGPTSRGIIVKENSEDILIQRCGFKEMKYYAVAVSYDYANQTRCRRVQLDKCYADHCGQIGTGGGSGGASTFLFDQVTACSVTECHLARCNWGISWLQPFTPPSAPEPFGYYNSVVNCIVTGSGLTGNPYPESQGISAQSQKHLRVIGNIVEAFNGNAIDNQRCEYSQIMHNTMRDCKDGIFIGDMAFIGHQIQGNNGYNCERGIRVLADASGSFTGQAMRSSVITGNSFGNCVSYGIYVHHNDPTGELSNVLIANNTVDNQGNRGGTTQVAGIYINGLTGGQVNNNTIRAQRRFGILVEACIGCQVHDNMINGYDFANLTAPAIYLDSACVGVSVRNNTGFGPTTAGALVYINGDKNACFGSRLRGAAQILLNSGTNTATGDNLAF